MEKTICFFLTMVIFVSCTCKDMDTKNGLKLNETLLSILESTPANDEEIVESEDEVYITETEDATIAPTDPADTDEKVYGQISTPDEGHALDILEYIEHYHHEHDQHNDQYHDESNYLEEYAMLAVHDEALQNLDDSEDHANKDQRSMNARKQQGTPNDIPNTQDIHYYPDMKKHNDLSWLYPKKRDTEPPKMSEKMVMKTQPDSPSDKQAWLSSFIFG